MAKKASGLRFVVLDDHELVRLGIAARLQADFPSSTLTYSGESLREAVVAVSAYDCDCAIVDLDLGDGTPVAEIVSAFSSRGIPVVVVSAIGRSAALESAFAAGAGAFVTKRSDLQNLPTAIDAVLAGKTWIAPDLAGVLVRADSGDAAEVVLSGQEKRALVLYASGLTIDMVARRMGITPNTVKHYVDRVRDKYTAAGITARTKVDLNRIAREEGLL